MRGRQVFEADLTWTGRAFEPGVAIWVDPEGPAGTRSDAFGTVMDLLPTFLELANTSHPGTTSSGEPVAPPRGASLLPLLRGETDAVHGPDYWVGWELYGHRAVRRGNWKIVWDPREGDDAAWQLFNLAEDPGEQHDLAAAEPERVRELEALWDRYVHENGVILVE